MPTYRAGTATINSGLSSVTVTIAMPDANYIVTVTPGGTSGSLNCLIVSGRTTTQFTVSNLQCSTGIPAVVTANLPVFWIAVEPN
jgi:hypothetical protein